MKKFCVQSYKTNSQAKSKYEILLALNIDETIKRQMFEIISRNMVDIGLKTNKNDYEIWSNSLTQQLHTNNHKLYLAFEKEKLVGYIQIVVEKDYIFLSEIEIKKEYQNTRLLLKMIEYLICNKDFSQYKNVHFRINKNNIHSIKTFEHLGATKEGMTEKAIKYSLTREQIIKILEKINKKSH